MVTRKSVMKYMTRIGQKTGMSNKLKNVQIIEISNDLKVVYLKRTNLIDINNRFLV